MIGDNFKEIIITLIWAMTIVSVVRSLCKTSIVSDIRDYDERLDDWLDELLEEYDESEENNKEE